MRLGVVAVSNGGCGDEQFEWVVFLGVDLARLEFLLQLAHSLLSVAGETQLFLVTPKYRGTTSHARLAQHVVQNHYL